MLNVTLNEKFTKADLDTNIFPFAVFNTPKGNQLVLKITIAKKLEIDYTFFVKNKELFTGKPSEEVAELLPYQKEGWQQDATQKGGAIWACMVAKSGWISNYKIREFFELEEVKEITAKIKEQLTDGSIEGKHLTKVMKKKNAKDYPNETLDLTEQFLKLKEVVKKFDFKGEHGKTMNATEFMDKYCHVQYLDSFGHPLTEATKEDIGYLTLQNTRVELRVENKYKKVDIGGVNYATIEHEITGGSKETMAYYMLELASKEGLVLVNLNECVDGLFAVLEKRVEELNGESLNRLNERVSRAPTINVPPLKPTPEGGEFVAGDKPEGDTEEHDDIHEAEFTDVEKDDEKE